MFQRGVPVGYQLLSLTTSAAVGLTMPVGQQQAQASSCTLSGKLLTVGGTQTGLFRGGQIVQGTGIPANTFIVGQGNVFGTWVLSNAATAGSGISVTAYRYNKPDLAVITVTGNVNWRDDGTAPTTTSGIGLQTSDPPFEYMGDLLAIQFIAQTGTPTVEVSLYKTVG